MKEKFDILRKGATITYGDIGIWAYAEWKKLNKNYFNNKLEVGAINFGITPHGVKLGAYTQEFNKIILHKSLILPSSENPWDIGKLLGRNYCSDVLLHQMIHQKIYQTYPMSEIIEAEKGSRASAHNNNLWVSEIIRLSGLMGILIKAEAIKQKWINEKIKDFVKPGHLTLKKISEFPHSVRKKSYYKDTNWLNISDRLKNKLKRELA